MSPPRISSNSPVSQSTGNSATPLKNAFYEQQLAAAQAAKAQAQAEADRLKAKIEEAKNKPTWGTNAIQQQQTISSLESQLGPVTEQIKAAEAKITDIKTVGVAGYTPFRIAVADAERAAADAEQAFKVGEADYNGTGIAWSRTSEGDLNNLRSERDRLQADLTALKANGELAWLDGQVSTARANLDAAKAELEAEKRKVGFSPDVAGAQEKVRAAQEALNTAGTQRQTFFDIQKATGAAPPTDTVVPPTDPVAPPPPADEYTDPAAPDPGEQLGALVPTEIPVAAAETSKTVEEGDYIWKIACEHYQAQYAAAAAEYATANPTAAPLPGPTQEEVNSYSQIATDFNTKGDANPTGFEDPNLIYPGDTVKLPALNFKIPTPPPVIPDQPPLPATDVVRRSTGGRVPV